MPHWVWWLIALAFVAAEMMSGAFYMLALGLACVAGAIAAIMDLTIEMQCLTASITAVFLCWLAYKLHPVINPSTPGVTPDIGQPVKVLSWNSDTQARVFYRGTQWDAELADPNAAKQEMMRIVATRGSTLVIAPEKETADMTTGKNADLKARR